MDNLDLAALSALDAKATPGPKPEWLKTLEDLHRYWEDQSPITADADAKLKTRISNHLWAHRRDIMSHTKFQREQTAALVAEIRRLDAACEGAKIQLSKYAYERELAKRERDKAENKLISISELFAEQNEELSGGHIETMAETLEKIWRVVNHD